MPNGKVYRTKLVPNGQKRPPVFMEKEYFDAYLQKYFMGLLGDAFPDGSYEARFHSEEMYYEARRVLPSGGYNVELIEEMVLNDPP